MKAQGATPSFNFVNHWPRRRDFVAGLLTACACAAWESPASAQKQDLIIPPAFDAGRFQFTILQPQRMLPAISLLNLDGTRTELQSLKGHVILLNFWATWCPACRKELPELQRLQAEHRADLRVVAVSVDRADHSTVKRFIQALNIRGLPIYLDPEGDVAYTDRGNRKNAPFALYGMPISYLIAASGRVVGYLPGAADWNSADAQKLLDFLKRS